MNANRDKRSQAKSWTGRGGNGRGGTKAVDEENTERCYARALPSVSHDLVILSWRWVNSCGTRRDAVAVVQ